MRVLLLGATGAAGRRTAAELLRQPEVDGLVLSGRAETAVARLAEAFDGGAGRVEARAGDLLGGSATPIREDVDVVVSCAGPSYELEEAAASAAIDAGVPYVSLCDEHVPFQSVRRLHGRAVAAGITVVSGCGLSPGITNMLVEHAVRGFDTVEAVEIALARSSVESSGGATARHFVYELGCEAPVIQDHRVKNERAGTSPKLVYFPEPVGWVETFRCGHPEVLSLPDRHPQLESLGFRIGLAERITMDTARAFAATPLIRSERARRTFVTITRPVRPLIDRLPPSGPPWTAARVDVHGSNNGVRTTTSLGSVDRLLNFASVPLTLAALRLGSGDVSGPGVRTPEEAFEPAPFLRDLTRRGIGIAKLEPSPL